MIVQNSCLLSSSKRILKIPKSISIHVYYGQKFQLGASHKPSLQQVGREFIKSLLCQINVRKFFYINVLTRGRGVETGQKSINIVYEWILFCGDR